MRTFLKTPDRRNIPIQAIGLSLYEDLGTGTSATQTPTTTAETIGKQVVRTQWLDFSTLGRTPLVGRRILIVDEVDDTRTTLAYAVNELQKDIKLQTDAMPADQKRPETAFAVFTVHNKLKHKAGEIPSEVMYFSGQDIDDKWVDYPWCASSSSLAVPSETEPRRHAFATQGDGRH